MAKTKISMRCNEVAEQLMQLTNRGVRKALSDGLTYAVEGTTIRTGNAAYHWSIYLGDTKPRMEYRTARNRRGKPPVVARKQTPVSKEVMASLVNAREAKAVLNSEFMGKRSPKARRFHLYNAIEDLHTSVDYPKTSILRKYRSNAIKIDQGMLKSVMISSITKFMRQGLASRRLSGYLNNSR